MALTLTPETESRILAEAARRNQAPEAVIDAALEALLRDEPMPSALENAAEESNEEKQTRLRRLMTAVLEEARTQEPEPYDSPARTYYRNHPFAQGVAEKMRQQGFNID